ncbi:MAG: NAD(P)H-binding protein [Deltaproteobacteria bacterium]|nr:NAD(P)H-binding protein [Deltaproteobacteria bacterium]
MGTIAIAGISGYTGLRVLPHLGHDAKLLLRPSTAKRPPWKDDARVVSVDLLDEHALERALAGVETVVCLVGTTRAQFKPAQDGEHAVDYETVDVGIPRALARAGKRAGCKRFVLLSSYGVERSPGAYPAAKRAAEAAVRDSGLSWAVLRPSFIVGPGRGAAKAFDTVVAPLRMFSRAAGDDMRSIDVEVLARAIVRVAASPEFDGKVLTGRDLHRLGRS